MVFVTDKKGHEYMYHSPVAVSAYVIHSGSNRASGRQPEAHARVGSAATVSKRGGKSA